MHKLVRRAVRLLGDSHRMRALSGRVAFLLTIGFVALPAARAVVVRGTVTDSLGAGVPAARVALVEGKKVVASTICGTDGTFEIRSDAAGRFILLTSAATFAPGIDGDFYGGRTDVISRTIVLAPAAVHADITVTATGTPTPVQQVASAVTLLDEQDYATRADVVDAMRQSPGVAVVQTGQYGGETSLFVRGGNSDANKVMVDGVTAEDVGGRFDYGTVATTGVTAMEMNRDPDSVLYGSDAVAGTVQLTTPRGMASKPQLDYAGDAGNFHTYRNELQLSGARQKLDYLAAVSRFNSSNALPNDEYHVSTEAANLGYSFNANTLARFTLRNQDAAQGLPNAHDFYGVSAADKQADQDIYSGLTLENRMESGWHNLLRYGIARKREQDYQFYPAGQYVANYDGFGDNAYFGNTVTIRGANGYTATGQAALAFPDDYPTHQYQDSNRDELYYQSDYMFPWRITGLFGFRYENERGSYVSNGLYAETETLQRTNYEYTLQFAGDVKSRLFYSLGGAIEKNHLYGMAGTPRVGLAYVPVRSSEKWMHGTRLRANFATGVQEPSLSIQFSSLYQELLDAGDTAAIAAYDVRPIGAPRSRSYDVGIDQNLHGEKLVLKLGYYHNQFSHQFDFVDAGTLKAVFGIDTSTAQLYGAEINSLAFRAQGLESEIQWQPLSRLFVRGGYTYLSGVVEQSFSTDAAYNGTATTNPNLPGVAIGSTYALVGARPFRRPPHTGYFTVQYIGKRFGTALQTAMASRSDDSTFLSYSDENGGNTLLLPNRDLDFGYAKMDLNGTYRAGNRTTLYVQLGNLLGQQHIGPIGYPGLPFTVRAGMKIRLGGE